MSSHSEKKQPIVLFTYPFSPYGQKISLLLTLAKLPFKTRVQPLLLPRPDLQTLGISYRRIPVLAIGKDVYCDSSLITSVIMSRISNQDDIAVCKADKAYEEWGTSVFREICMGLFPFEAISPELRKDRASIFPAITRPVEQLKSLRPSALASLQTRMKQIEDSFLSPTSDGPFIGGGKAGLADIHVFFAVRWALKDLGVAKEGDVLGMQAFPRLWKAIESLPPYSLDSEGEVTTEAMLQMLKGSEYSANKGPKGVMDSDPLGLEAGTKVVVESTE